MGTIVKKWICWLIFLTIGMSSSMAQYKQEPEEVIPFFIDNGHIIIRVLINDSGPFNYLFDSGAGATLIAKSLSDSLNLTVSRQKVNTGAAGAHKVDVLKNIIVRIGKVQLEGMEVLASKTGLEDLANGEPILGVIGYHLLNNYVVRVDYNSMKLMLYDKSKYTYTGSGESIPITLVYNIPVASAKVGINDNKMFVGSFLIDTGSSSTIIFSSPTVDHYDLLKSLDEAKEVRTQLGTSNRKTKLVQSKISFLSLGSSAFHSVPSSFSRSDVGVLSLYDFDGIIGNKILGRFNITFDYQKSRLYLESNEYYHTPFPDNVAGLTIRFANNKPIIRSLTEGSPASKAGLRQGDAIVSINGKLVEEMRGDEIREIFHKYSEKLKLVIQRGRKLKYTEIHPENSSLKAHQR